MSIIAEQAFDKDYDNVNDINQSVQDLYNIYVAPIDAIRSKSLPNLSDPNSLESETNPNTPLESKVHAFYRMLGFPVVTPSGKFYNPGFNPLAANYNSIRFQDEIDKEFYNNKIYNFIYDREKRLINLYNLFKKNDLSIENTVYCLCTKYFSSFNVLELDMNPLGSYNQVKKVQDRIDYFDKFVFYNDSELYDQITSFANIYSEIPHQLHPFITDPRICKSVAPDLNLICVPFLPNKSLTAIKKNTYLKKPGIELIIRMRLEGNSFDSSFLKNISNIAKKSIENLASNSNFINNNFLSNIILFSENLKFPKDIEEQLSNVSDIQFRISVKLIKLLKVCIDKLQKSSNLLDIIENQINWVPVVAGNGPIDAMISGSKNSNLNNSYIVVDNKIKELELKKLNAEISVQDFNSLGDFASPFSSNLFSEDINLYTENINELKNLNKSIEMSGFQHLKNIEMLAGTTSGLGLIDVISIYLALWTVDLKVLLALLDRDAFERLLSEQNEKYAGSSIVQDQRDSPMGILEALTKFQNKLYNILEFSDMYLRNNQQNSPNFVNDSFLG